MKHVLLLDATGTAGSALTQKLLADTNCRLTVFARHAGAMYADTDRITVVNGNAEHFDELRTVMPGHDVCTVPFPAMRCPKSQRISLPQ